MIQNKLSTLGGGCFWCIEGMFQRLKGVSNVKSGYEGGQNKNPTYEQVCSGQSGHAEVIQFNYDESIITYQDIINIFMKVHDPTTLNRQGNDRGTQYRSVIYYHDNVQKEIAQKIISELSESKYYSDPIVTELSPSTIFYPAEDYHQNYYNEKGSSNGYCNAVVDPKIKKFMKTYADKLQ